MPNWCYTDLVFYSENKDDIKKLRKDIIKTYHSVNKHSKSWWGNIVKLNKDFHLLEETEDGKLKIGYIRCFISSVCDKVYTVDKGDKTYYCIDVISEDAWCPCTAMYDYICEKYNVKYAMYAIEYGCDVFVIKDDDKLFFEDAVGHLEFYILDHLSDEEIQEVKELIENEELRRMFEITLELADNYGENFDITRTMMQENYGIEDENEFGDKMYVLSDLLCNIDSYEVYFSYTQRKYVE